MAKEKESFAGHRTLIEKSPAGNIHRLVINPKTPKKDIDAFYKMVKEDTGKKAESKDK